VAEEPCPAACVRKVDGEVAAGLSGPRRGRVCGRAQDAYPLGGVLDHREDVPACASQRHDFEGVGREDGLGLGVQELRPGGGGLLGCWVGAGVVEGLPDGGRGDVDPKHEEFAVDAPVPSRTVLQDFHVLDPRGHRQ
jgi:hypothetical protein